MGVSLTHHHLQGPESTEGAEGTAPLTPRRTQAWSPRAGGGAEARWLV